MRHLCAWPDSVLESLARIENRLALYASQLEAHPFLELARTAMLPRPVLDEFAYLQYVDSILWVPMLALMKERVRAPRLARALRDNLACEAGYRGTSHVELALRFVRSLGISSPPVGCEERDVVQAVSQWTRFCEPQIAGWLFAAESLVPVLFRLVRPSYQDIPGVDLRYLDEHLHVDADEHACWMKEAVLGLLGEPAVLGQVLQGVDIGAREVFGVPDTLYARTLWIGDSLGTFRDVSSSRSSAGMT